MSTITTAPTLAEAEEAVAEVGQVPLEWPPRPQTFGDLMTPVEAAQYLRLDETGTHTPKSALRVLNYWRDHGELRATRYVHHVWFRRVELDRFLEQKTED